MKDLLNLRFIVLGCLEEDDVVLVFFFFFPLSFGRRNHPMDSQNPTAELKSAQLS